MKLKILSIGQLSEYIGRECCFAVARLVMDRLVSAGYEDTIEVPDSVWNQFVELSYWEVYCPNLYENHNQF